MGLDRTHNLLSPSIPDPTGTLTRTLTDTLTRTLTDALTRALTDTLTRVYRKMYEGGRLPGATFLLMNGKGSPSPPERYSFVLPAPSLPSSTAVPLWTSVLASGESLLVQEW